MKKMIAVLLALTCVFALCACGGEKQQEEGGELELDLTALSTQMLEKMQESQDAVIPQLNENMALNLYGLTAEDCAELLVFSDYDATKCNELWLIKAADEAALEQVKTLAQSRVDSLLAQSQNYNADVYAASEDARIETRGLYLALIVTTAGDSDQVADLFLNA